MNKSLMISISITQKDVGDKRLPNLVDMIWLSNNGIANSKITRDQIQVTFDQQVYKFSDIMLKLSDVGMKIEKGFLFRLKSFWLDYLDTATLENASAPPPSCCNKLLRRAGSMRQVIFVVLVALTITACDVPEGASSSNPLYLPPQGFVGDSAQGEVLYASNCLSCHGVDGSGTPSGPPLVNETYNPRHHADLSFNLAVKNGVRSHHWRFGDMKPVPSVTPEGVSHITQYVREKQRQAGID